MGENQGSEGKEGEVASSCGFQIPTWILACGVWIMRMGDSCTAHSLFQAGGVSSLYLHRAWLLCAS
jgi:hypothetical protein